MVISSRVGSTEGEWTALDAIPEVEEAKHQSGSGWIRNWCNFEVDFEFINWISKSFWNDPSTLCSCFQMAKTSSFQLQFAHRLKHWNPDFPSFETIYNMYKNGLQEVLQICPQNQSIYYHKIFWVLNFHAAKSCFMPHFPCFLAFFLTP